VAWFTWSKFVGLLALAGLAVAFGVTYLPRPARWTSGVNFAVRTQDGGAAEHFSEIAKGVLATPSLAAIIRIDDLYKTERADGSIDRAVDHMRKDLRLRAEGPSGGNSVPWPTSVATNGIRFAHEDGFRVEFTYSDPAKAQLAANSVASRFMDEGMALVAKAIDQGRRPPLMQIGVASLASNPREAPNPLASARLGLAVGGLFGAAAAWFLGRRRAAASA
jgi:hypothetical protein